MLVTSAFPQPYRRVGTGDRADREARRDGTYPGAVADPTTSQTPDPPAGARLGLPAGGLLTLWGDDVRLPLAPGAPRSGTTFLGLPTAPPGVGHLRGDRPFPEARSWWIAICQQNPESRSFRTSATSPARRRAPARCCSRWAKAAAILLRR